MLLYIYIYLDTSMPADCMADTKIFLIVADTTDLKGRLRETNSLEPSALPSVRCR